MVEDRCVHRQSGSKVAVKDKNSGRAVFINPKRAEYRCVLIDGCVIKEGLRADWLVESESGKQVVVELKGSDVPHALKQISNTVDVGVSEGWINLPVGAWIVASKLRPAALTTIQAGMKKHQERFGARLRLDTSFKERYISDFL